MNKLYRVELIKEDDYGNDIPIIVFESFTRKKARKNLRININRMRSFNGYFCNSVRYSEMYEDKYDSEGIVPSYICTYHDVRWAEKREGDRYVKYCFGNFSYTDPLSAFRNYCDDSTNTHLSGSWGVFKENLVFRSKGVEESVTMREIEIFNV